MLSLCDLAELRPEDLILEYQPIFDLHHLRISRAEALIRWNHPVLGRLLPARFLPSLLRSSTMQDITQRIFRQAASQLAHWRRNGYKTLRVCVNLALEELTDALPSFALEVLNDLRLSPADIELEVSEQGTLLDDVAAVSVVRRLRSSGFRISIDDFGAGSASLRYLLDVPASTVKFDRSFIAGVPCKRHAAVLSYVSKLAAELGHQVIVEGIENEDQLQTATSCGAHHAQGCYLSPPVPAELFERRLRDWDGSCHIR